MYSFIKQSKLSYQLYNFFNKAKLEHNLSLYKKYGIEKKYYSSVSAIDFNHLESPLNKYDKLNTQNELPNETVFNSLNKTTKEALLPWSDKGFAILKSFFDTDKINQINIEVENLLNTGKINWKYGNKLMFAIHQSSFLKEIGTNSELLNILNLLMGKEVKLFQSINFYKGSEQKTHSDSVHMSTFPYGNLIAIWVALENITLKNGPLHYYSGSHKLPYIMNKDFGNLGNKYMLGNKSYAAYEKKIEEVVKKSEFKKQVFEAEKGDVLIWHANLLHGGNKMLDSSLTRKSMVFHYYTKDAICYHEITQRPTLKYTHWV